MCFVQCALLACRFEKSWRPTAMRPGCLCCKAFGAARLRPGRISINHECYECVYTSFCYFATLYISLAGTAIRCCVRIFAVKVRCRTKPQLANSSTKRSSFRKRAWCCGRTRRPLLYLILFLVVCFYVYRFIIHRFELQKQKLEDEKQKEFLCSTANSQFQRWKKSNEMETTTENSLPMPKVCTNGICVTSCRKVFWMSLKEVQLLGLPTEHFSS